MALLLLNVLKGESMKLQLAPSGVFWALMHPSGSFYVGGETNEGGYSRVNSQDVQVILTHEDPGPVELDYNGLPDWAKTQVLDSKKSGFILVEGLPDLKPQQKVSTVVAKAAPLDLGILALSVAEIKSKTQSSSVAELSTLLAKEQQGLNSSGKARSNLVAHLKGKIESLKE